MPIRLAVVAVLILLTGYGLIKAWPLLSGPEIVLDSPADGATIGDGFVTISGTAKYARNLSLDGGPLLMDEQGHFSTTQLLPRGTAILGLTATDRFGHTKSAKRTVFVP